MAQSQSAHNFGKIQFGATSTPPAPIIFGVKDAATTSSSTKSSLFDFGTKSPFTAFPATTKTDAKPPQSTSITFGQEVSKTDSSAASIFGQKPGLSFAELASSSQPLGFGGGFKANAAPNAFALFGGQATPSKGGAEDANDEDNGGNDNQNPEEYVPQVDFKPLVKLNEVEVKTGEEDEDIEFKARCKLYRFNNDTKEWKEKGAGEIKILKHKNVAHSYRVIMRRDQIFKLCANHRITAEIKCELFNEKQVRWMANDCSEGTVRAEYLTAKFRHEDEAKQFRAEFEKAQVDSKQAASVGRGGSVKQESAVAMGALSSLASVLKIEDGSWKCQGCLTLNKPDKTKCECCEQAKVDDSNSSANHNGGKTSFYFPLCVGMESRKEELIFEKKRLFLGVWYY